MIEVEEQWVLFQWAEEKHWRTWLKWKRVWRLKEKSVPLINVFHRWWAAWDSSREYCNTTRTNRFFRDFCARISNFEILLRLWCLLHVRNKKPQIKFNTSPRRISKQQRQYGFYSSYSTFCKTTILTCVHVRLCSRVRVCRVSLYYGTAACIQPITNITEPYFISGAKQWSFSSLYATAWLCFSINLLIFADIKAESGFFFATFIILIRRRIKKRHLAPQNV